jgi:hypothetical protein
VRGRSSKKYWKSATYRTVSDGNCESASGIEPVKLLCDKSKYWTALRFAKEDDISPSKPLKDIFTPVILDRLDMA